MEINTHSGYGLAHSACTASGSMTMRELLECLAYCHGILSNTTFDQGSYFKAKET